MKLHEVVKTIDGDTLVVFLELEFDVFIKKHLRLYGIDCPEKNTIAGKKVKKWVEDWISQNIQFLQLEVIENEDKYGRVLTKIKSIKENGTLDLSEELIKEGYAKSFSGHGQRGWNNEELLLVEEKLKEIEI